MTKRTTIRGTLTAVVVAGAAGATAMTARGAGNRYGAIQLTGKEGERCYLPVTLVGAHDVLIDNQAPQDAPAVALSDGSSAYAQLHWTGVESAEEQQTPNGISVTAPAASNPHGDPGRRRPPHPGRGVMTKRLSKVIPVALAAGGLLLTACGTGDATASGSDSALSTSETASSTSETTPSTSDTSEPAPATSATEAGLEPVDCGDVTLDTGAVHRLIATPAANGIVGCTEAFNVVDEFVKLPPEKRSEASLGNVTLASGWSCTVDDGATANLGCVKDKVGDDYGFALHTEQQAG